MALSIPSYPNPFDPAHPIPSAYGWIAGIYLDLAGDSGRIVLNVHPGASAWQSPPIGQVKVDLGQAGFPRLVELMASTATVGTTGVTFAQAYAVIGQALYEELRSRVPGLAGSTVV